MTSSTLTEHPAASVKTTMFFTRWIIFLSKELASGLAQTKPLIKKYLLSFQRFRDFFTGKCEACRKCSAFTYLYECMYQNV